MRALPVFLWALLIALMPLRAASAKSEDPDSQKGSSFICPIGGKAFTQNTSYDAFPLITMPDGSWLGDTEIGAQIPVCPENGLVLIPDIAKIEASGSDALIYTDYSAAERVRLPALIADPAYQALKADGPYAQAYWLASQLGRPGEDRFFMLQRSTWATRDPAVRKRLVARLAADGMAVIETSKAPEATKRFHAAYVANALRELGRFDEALALLDKVEAAGPPVLKPQDPDSLFGPDAFAPQLRLAIAEKDDGRFAAEMLPKRMLSDICDEKLTMLYGPTGPATKAACKTRRDRSARESKESDAMYAESRKWNEKPAERDKACAATPEDKRNPGLSEACRSAQNDRDQLAGRQLAKDGPALAAACEATPETDQQGPLSYGCISYGIALESALGDALAGDDAAWRILCPGAEDDAYVPDRDNRVSMGCSNALRQRQDRAEAKLLEDPVKLDALCAATKGGETVTGMDHAPLFSACYQRQLARESAAEAKPGRNHSPESKAVYPACPRGKGAAATACRDASEANGGLTPMSAIVGKSPNDEVDIFDENSSLSMAARAQAAKIIAKAKADGTYPKRKPGDRM